MNDLQIQVGDELPPKSTVARSAKRANSLDYPPVQAFKLRKAKNEQELSVSWLEFFTDCPTFYERLGAACTHFARNYEPGKTDRVLCVDVDHARSLLSSIAALSAVKIVYWPEQDDPGQKITENPSHAAVIGVAGLSEALEQLAAEQLALAVTPNIWEWSDLRSLGLVIGR